MKTPGGVPAADSRRLGRLAPLRRPRVAIAVPTLPKNSPAIRFETLVSIRWPTPPTMPPTTASAS